MNKKLIVGEEDKSSSSPFAKARVGEEDKSSSSPFAKARVNKEKCVSCGICATICPGAIELKEDGKAEVIDQEKLKDCGEEKVCPIGAIEKAK